MPERVDGVLTTLYEVSLELFAASLLGPRSKSPAVGDVWSQVLPAVPRLVLRDPNSVAAALSKAAYNLARTGGARSADWIESVRRTGPRCENVAELLNVGTGAAWRAGMPHYRGGAIAAAKRLRPEVAGEILGVPAESVGTILDRMLSDPWLSPAAAAAAAATDPESTGALRLVGVVGAFRGFGGEFLRPPRVTAAANSIFVCDGDATYRLVCDCFGRLLMRHDLPSRADAPATDVRVSPEGVVQWGAGRASFPHWAGDVGGFACDGHTIAVTLRTSHHVYLVARASSRSQEKPAHGG
jgi:hypothetical protein